MTNILPLPRIHRTLGAYTPAALPQPNWWQRLSTGQRVNLVMCTIITGILIAALMAIPDPFYQAGIHP